MNGGLGIIWRGEWSEVDSSGNSDSRAANPSAEEEGGEWRTRMDQGAIGVGGGGGLMQSGPRWAPGSILASGLAMERLDRLCPHVHRYAHVHEICRRTKDASKISTKHSNVLVKRCI